MMWRPERPGPGVVIASLVLMLAACSGKLAKVGGESHFVCQSERDCPPYAPVCVHEDGGPRGVCHSQTDASKALGSSGSGGQSGVSDAAIDGHRGGTAVGAGGLVSTTPPSSSGSGGASALLDAAIDAPRDGTTVSAGGTAIGAGGTVSSTPPPVGPSACAVSCCPSDGACYADANLKDNSPGAECLATRDNTGQPHIQLRQTWTNSTAPPGNTIPIIYGVRAGRSDLPLNGRQGTPDCHMGNGALGSGGLIELVDIFGDTAKIGYSRYVSPMNVLQSLAEGLCMGNGTYAGDPSYRFTGNQIPPGAQWPAGLSKPMGLNDAPWQLVPTRAKRLDADFAIPRDRVALLGKLAADGEYGRAGFTGVFTYSQSTGFFHAYAPLSWQVEYISDGSLFTAVPVREAETLITFNDPDHPNCVGKFGTDPSMTVANGCKPPGKPEMGAAWGDGDCKNTTGNATCGAGEGPAMTRGYALITELQQIFAPDLGITLCVFYPGQQTAQTDGFYDDATKGCITQKWDPGAPDSRGLPHGDWCAATNSTATPTCHDAFRVEAFQTFSGAKIQLASGGGEAATCPF